VGTLFSFSAGTDGHGPERYRAFVPFVLSPGVDLNLQGQVEDESHDPFSLQLKPHLTHFSVSAMPLHSESEAAHVLAKLRAGLLWFSLLNSVGVRYSKEEEPPTFYAQPQLSPNFQGIGASAGWTAVDGCFEGRKAAVLPEHRRLVQLDTGCVSIRLGQSPSSLFRHVRDTLK
jgi:hypothetical protein